MARKSLVEAVAEDLLERILEGEVGPHEALPPEAEIAREADVSRLTVREALKALQAQNIVYVRRGLGTYVNPPDAWTGLEAILKAAARGTTSHQVALRLLEVRRMVETGSAELAAVHVTPQDLVAMEDSVRDLERAHEAQDLDEVTRADMAFHDAVLRASGNPFVPVLLAQLSQLLYVERRATSAFPEVQRHAIEHHRRVLEAIGTRDPETARKAMEAHIDQTYTDYEHYIGRGAAPGDPAPAPGRAPDPAPGPAPESPGPASRSTGDD
ncbi:UNVERIFIED_CONTAM: FadR/GntR family transcriptional regulator [Kocuria sp. CPCC 205316]|uniref:FadR/GntR family transcriptional regulator n=1 Tax=Kocuria TaxID=57493 RepID=UPI0036D992BF